MRPVVVLLDIDGTLISTGGAGRLALSRAFEKVYGRRDACDAVPFAGRTDRAIVRGGLRAIGESDDDASIERMIDAYVDVLPGALAATEDRYVVHDHALELVAGLKRLPHLAVGLGTGNVERGAKLKLARAGFGEFDFGGYGSDAEKRDELLGAGKGRGIDALRKRGLSLDGAITIVVGDTEHDVTAGRSIDAHVAFVSPRRSEHDAMKLLGAGVTAHSLREVEAWIFDLLRQA